MSGILFGCMKMCKGWVVFTVIKSKRQGYGSVEGFVTLPGWSSLMTVQAFRSIVLSATFGRKDREWFPVWLKRFGEYARSDDESPLKLTRDMALGFSRELLANGVPAWQSSRAGSDRPPGTKTLQLAGGNRPYPAGWKSSGSIATSRHRVVLSPRCRMTSSRPAPSTGRTADRRCAFLRTTRCLPLRLGARRGALLFPERDVSR